MTLVRRKYTQTHSFDFSLLCSKIATLTIKNQYFAFAKLKIMFHSLITMHSTTEIQILKQFWDLGFFHVSLNVPWVASKIPFLSPRASPSVLVLRMVFLMPPSGPYGIIIFFVKNPWKYGKYGNLLCSDTFLSVISWKQWFY